MLPALLLLLTTATPVHPVDVVVSRRIDLPADRANLIARDLSRALLAAKVNDVRAPEDTRSRLKTNPESCDARRACVAKLGVALSTDVIISIDVGVVADRMALNLEAIAPRDGEALLRKAFAINAAGDETELARALDTFAAALATKIQERWPKRAEDAPAVVVLDQPAVEVEPEEPSVAPKVVAGAAVVTGVAAVAFAALGVTSAQSLEAAKYESASGPASRLTESEARATAADANTRYAIAGACGAASLALTATAIYLFTK